MGVWQAHDDYNKTVQEMELDAEFNEIACISDFKMLTVASETSIYARTAEIKCKQLRNKTSKNRFEMPLITSAS